MDKKNISNQIWHHKFDMLSQRAELKVSEQIVDHVECQVWGYTWDQVELILYWQFSDHIINCMKNKYEK